MIPLKISESPRRPKRSLRFWPKMPDQFTFMANHSAGVLTIPGVHSIVWIFAISAELISHPVSNSRWSSQPGFSRLSMSQIALCSLVNSVCRHESPNHQFSLKPLRSTPLCSGSSGRRSWASIFSLPSLNVRSAFCRSCVEP